MTVGFRNTGYSIGGRPILRGISMQVEPGETLVLLGRSGSGKTTALKLVNCLLTPDQGQVLVDGRPTTAWNPIQLRRRIGYVIQEAGLFPHYTVAQNVAVVPQLEGWPAARIQARVDEVLTLVGLPPAEFAHRYPRQLSGGQRQRVGVARALAADPPVLLLDEPFGAVDPITRVELQREFVALRARLHTASLFVTHDVQEALRVGTRLALLHNGQLAELAAPDGFLRSTHPEARAFLACLPT